MKDPRMDEFRAWQKASNGLLNKIALAPEREGVEDFVRTITDEGVTVALGHSNATFEEAKAAVDAVFTPTDNVIMSSELAIYEAFMNANIPHYAGADSFVRSGAFATCGVNYTDAGIKTAKLAYEVLLPGFKKAEEFITLDGGIITVNTEVAEKLGVNPDIFADFGQVVTVEITGK